MVHKCAGSFLGLSNSIAIELFLPRSVQGFVFMASCIKLQILSSAIKQKSDIT